ncbi:unannotated protein [freshwater metagenome]|uniref:Unannotated protein n=1 Tax=freshwater metagenome TaxID=449393 RepID=A0A6J6UL02_9ZZZZ
MLEPGAGDPQVGDVPVDEGDCFGAEAMPQQGVDHSGRLDGLVHLREPLVVGLVEVQDLVRVEELPQGGDGGEVGCEPVLRVDAGEPLDGVLQGHERRILSVDPVEPCDRDSDAVLELDGEGIDVDVALPSRVRVGGLERGGDLIAEADVVDDEPVGLLMPGRGVREPPVCAGDRLEQGVLSQRLVEVHRLLDAGVEPGEEFRGHDEERQRVVGVVEPCLDVGVRLRSLTRASTGEDPGFGVGDSAVIVKYPRLTDCLGRPMP